MTQLQILTQFKELFNDVQEMLQEYNDNLRNELFEIEPNEDHQQAYKRGETIFDRCEDDIRNISEILEKKDQIDKFFETCQQNKQQLIKQKNLIIDKLVRIKKKSSNKEEYVNYREEWNKRRRETADEKNRRECEEMLDDIKEEKKFVEKLIKYMKREREELKKVKEEVQHIIKNGRMEEIKKDLIEEMTKKIDLFGDEYLKKNDFNVFLSTKQKHHFPISQFSEMEESPQKQLPQSQPNENEMRKQTRLTSNQLKQLEEWTNLKCSEIVFDTEKDKWKAGNCVLNKNIIGKKQLLFLIEDEDGEKFGYYLNTEVKTDFENRCIVDKKTFHFNLQSQNGRLNKPMKFEIKDTKWGGYKMSDDNAGRLIWLGNIILYKEGMRNRCDCEQKEDEFNFHGIKKALCGKVHPEEFTIKRILVIQME